MKLWITQLCLVGEGKWIKVATWSLSQSFTTRNYVTWRLKEKMQRRSTVKTVHWDSLLSNTSYFRSIFVVRKKEHAELHSNSAVESSYRKHLNKLKMFQSLKNESCCRKRQASFEMLIVNVWSIHWKCSAVNEKHESRLPNHRKSKGFKGNVCAELKYYGWVHRRLNRNE